MKTQQPVAYLRKSRVTNDRHVSWEVQEGKIRQLAAQHGDDELRLLSDWNRSGGKGANGRPGYHQLLDMIEADQVSALYAYSLSRLSRSISDFANLAELCIEHKVPMRLAADQNLDFTSASGRFVINVLVSIAQMERELASERSKDTVAVRRARGDRIGHPFYGGKDGEDVAAVMEAYRDAGSVIGAGRLLNDRGVPTRQGRPWSTTPVREILQRHNALPHRKRPGAKNAAPFLLFHLVKCHCGRLMSAARFRNGPEPGYVVYRCLAGRTTTNHGRLNVSENKLLPWVKAEAERFRVPFEQVMVQERDESRRLELEARRQRVIDNYEDALIDKAGRDAKLLKIGDEMANLDAADRILDVPPTIDWSWEPKAVNTVLRAMWEHIELDANMRPVEAVWRVPEWRR
jgi:DNA invertase Pin-like site-specific DNA recombinase